GRAASRGPSFLLAARFLSIAVDEGYFDARLQQFGEFLCIPVCQAHTTVRGRLADFVRIGSAMYAVGRLGEIDPHGANRVVGSRWQFERLGIVALLKILLGAIG